MYPWCMFTGGVATVRFFFAENKSLLVRLICDDDGREMLVSFIRALPSDQLSVDEKLVHPTSTSDGGK